MDLKEDGSFWLDQSYFNYATGLTMTSTKFNDLFDGKPRDPEDRLTQREMDLAASVQKVTEEVMLRMRAKYHGALLLGDAGRCHTNAWQQQDNLRNLQHM